MNVPYFAMYSAHFFAQIFEGKSKDVDYTWVVLICHQYIKFLAL